VRYLNPQKKSIIRIREITPVRLPMQRNIMLLRQGEEFFQVPGLAHQPIRVIHDHMPHPTRPDRLQQRVPPRTVPGPFPRRTIVIHQHTIRHDDQPEPLGDLPTQPLLAIHPGLILIPGIRDPAIDRRRLTHPPRPTTTIPSTPGPSALLTASAGHTS
jgi:hypothetical protein